MYHDPYGYERPHGRRWAAAGVGAVIVLIAALALWQLRSGSGDASDGPTSSTTTSTSTTVGAPSPATTNRATGTGGTTSQPTTVDSTDTTVVPATTNLQRTADTEPTMVPGDASIPYPTSPDGTPLPLVVVFDVDTITIAGQVPSQAAKDRLASLAVANSQFPDAAVIDNMVINPAVPISVGVRVIELNSARFPEGTADILPDHALELDRVVGIMQALPNISVLVIGHADQRGDDVKNFAISDARARAVVNYLLYLGISQTRLASRAAGESDLLTLLDDDASLALNRRTEFVFYGLLVE